ncbi:hypothetical protein H6S82_18820 [Planktothrix sp. FACHB-1355]|uniref:Uncharacterized protein n=1 Tax=Aerosakkonema funiforme FACHB-1375 TaxID=2949571 RepID=A0A926VJE3_9CYAN|nr:MULTISPECIES: hypothetical protein [Oscillatoriales]MBD2184954.1 hypothetical protein [Aerosakkonema funiforme FACHB-1375]MBD3560887.1 hypothetical protein [Planktothrix sp. FACHB-1355]
MKRRKFIQTGALASASFMTSSGLLVPKQADAVIFLLFRLLGGSLLDLAFGMLLQGAFSVATRAWNRRNQDWFDKRLQAQLAQRSLIDRYFTNQVAAEIPSAEYRYIVAATNREQLGENVAFSIPRLVNDEPIISTFSGPASLGMVGAAKYLSENTLMTPGEIQRAIFPPHEAAARFHDNMGGWNTSGNIAYPNSYNPGGTGVLIRYMANNPRLGGYGNIQVTVYTDRPILIGNIRVEYAPS